MEDLLTHLRQVISQDGGGSGMGLSHYMQIDTCPRKAKLASIDPISNVPSFQRDLGTAFHRIKELEDINGMGEYILPSSIYLDPRDAVMRAWQTYLEYRKHYAGEALDILHVEEVFSTETHPRLKELIKAPFSIKPDRVAIPRSLKHMPVGVEVGKKYLWDYKTKKARPSNIEELYTASGQFILYNAVYNFLHPDAPLQGTIVDCVFNYTKFEPKCFHRVFIPQPSEAEITAWITFIERTYETQFYDVCRLSSCSGFFGSRCVYYDLCDKISTGERYE